MAEARGTTEQELRWFVGIPVGTNPLILADLAALLVFLWAVTPFDTTLLITITHISHNRS